MFSLVGFVFVSGFVLGILAIVAAEAAGLMYLINRLNRKKHRSESNPSSDQSLGDLDPQQSTDFCLTKQGIIWILELDEGLKNWMTTQKLLKEQKRRRVFLEVQPVRKFARIRDHNLILSDFGSSRKTVCLKGCSVDAVSNSELHSKKWAKRFPIKVESKTSAIYNGNRVFYVYVETSWEKESWCKALRLAACEDREKHIWFIKLKEEFRNYLTSLNAEYPSFMKPLAGFSFEALVKGDKVDGSSSKVSLFWKKLSKKALNKSNFVNPLGREDRKVSEKIRPHQDSQSGSSSVKSIPAKKDPDNMTEETNMPTFSRTISRSSHDIDLDSGDKFYTDEGTLAWNLLIARLFFDAKQNTGLKNSIQERLQRTLSNMRTPSYIGELTCCGLDLGNLPPYIHGIRVLPMEMSNAWAFEIDVEYCGGVVLDVETRVEVRDMDLQNDITDTSLQPSSISQDLLAGLEDFEKHLSPGENVHEQDREDERDTKSDGSKGSKGTTAASNDVPRWRSILKNIAQQVSQVPISLSIRVSSLRGTLRLHIKPPPSDQLWYGFITMPDIEFDLTSSVGERKITSSHVAMFLINRFKTAFREAMVLPNCESICIPWMAAEKDDWVQREVAPFMWLNQEAASDHNIVQAGEAKSRAEANNIASSSLQADQKQKIDETQQPVSTEPAAVSSASSSSTAVAIQSDKSSDELKIPLLGSNEKQETNTLESTRDIQRCQSASRSFSAGEEDESKVKKMGRKARMMDLGKKMGEKLEEKRRHIEEKSRHIVEKMRGP